MGAFEWSFLFREQIALFDAERRRFGTFGSNGEAAVFERQRQRGFCLCGGGRGDQSAGGICHQSKTFIQCAFIAVCFQQSRGQGKSIGLSPDKGVPGLCQLFGFIIQPLGIQVCQVCQIRQAAD